MPGTVEIKKVLGGIQDLTFGMGQEAQIRNGVEYIIDQINSGHIPYTEAQSIADAFNTLFAIIGTGGAINPVVSIYAFGGQLTLAEITALDVTINKNIAYMSTTTGVLPNGSAVLVEDYISSNGISWYNIGNLNGIKGDTGDTGATGPTGPAGPAPTQTGYAGRFLRTDGSDLTPPTWEEAVTPVNYATSIKGGVVKMRITNGVLYITNDGSNA